MLPRHPDGPLYMVETLTGLCHMARLHPLPTLCIVTGAFSNLNWRFGQSQGGASPMLLDYWTFVRHISFIMRYSSLWVVRKIRALVHALKTTEIRESPSVALPQILHTYMCACERSTCNSFYTLPLSTPHDGISPPFSDMYQGPD